MSDVALQIERSLLGAVDAGTNVVFDAVVYSNGDVDYDDTTGVITFNEAGRYALNWWVATQASASPTGAVFALESSQGDFIVGNSPIKTGEVVGIGIINVVAAPVTVSLINASPASFRYSSLVPIKATLVAVEDDVPVPGPTGPTGPTGPEGPTGATGPTGPAGDMADTMTCFAVAQLANILSQMIEAYPTTTWTVFSQSLGSYSGMPLDLYTSPEATGPGILRLIDVNDDYEALPIANITAVYPGDGTVWDPSFTFLTPPDPLPTGCDADMIAAIQSYLPVGIGVDIRLGPAIVATGDVYRNEYGVIVLSDVDGNTPNLLATPHILRIFTDEDPTAQPIAPRRGGRTPRVFIDKSQFTEGS